MVPGATRARVERTPFDTHFGQPAQGGVEDRDPLVLQAGKGCVRSLGAGDFRVLAGGWGRWRPLAGWFPDERSTEQEMRDRRPLVGFVAPVVDQHLDAVCDEIPFVRALVTLLSA